MDEYLYKKSQCGAGGMVISSSECLIVFTPLPTNFLTSLDQFYKDSVSDFVVEILVMNFGE